MLKIDKFKRIATNYQGLAEFFECGLVDLDAG